VAAWALGGGVEVGSDIAVVVANDVAAAPYLSDWVPVTLSDGTVIDVAETLHGQFTDGVRRGGFAVDIALRDQTLPAIDAPDIAILRAAQDGPITGCAYNLRVPADGGVMALLFDASRIDSAHAARMIARLEMAAQAVIAQPEGAISALPMLSEAERAQVLTGWNETALATDAACVHHAIEAQVLRSPDATAVVFEGQSLSYSALNVAANRVAHRLIAMGIGPGNLVGLHCARSLDLMIAALGILKAGGAYVPLDPAYPLDRLAHYIADSAAPVIITQSALAGSLPEHAAQLLVIDADPLNDQPEENPESSISTDDLAYVIYTSGSTGTPKGVMVEHGNVANFFDGMDARVPHDMGAGQQVWLAVTSLSFDISVLELFYTLARGFKVVVGGDKQQMQVSNGSVATQGGMEFSIYYWGNDDAPGPKKYELLLEGAKFADQNGFVAVWTPERHFHAFGGPYPNPSVTGAAAAAVTKNIGVRAGSCVAPLHHTARIAEEWAVIDNLTNGRAGLAIASGWQPDDFVLRPENTPPENRTAMFEQIRDLRKLWRGEAVDFPRADGTMFSAVTQPRPVSDAPEIWVTTAGNPETWKEAGKAGAHILTHLLGQSISEVQQKIGLYHDALREAGYDPAEFKITLMLHTFVGADREEVRETAREPMKNYLRSAAGLIKQYAWAFPAFKKPEGVSNPFQLDLGSLSEDELEGILDFAFLRYFEDSGLFGTVEDCVTRVEELKLAGVSEVACLIDYGIATDVVLEGLKPLAEVLRRTNVEGGPHDRDFSLAAQMVRHGVTHLQCTPSMARMLVTDDVARGALRGVEHLFIGGEALPGTLVRELSGATTASIENMYGPTETTIWSTTGAVDEAADAIADTANIGSPITNTQVYVLSEEMQPVPVGVAGELYIGGKGVTRGYLQRDTLTAERFVDNPFDAGRMYRTGDLVRWRQDGTLDFLGRIDHQVKLRGYRIELGEIEAKLEALDAIGQAVVIAREDQPGDIRLVGYVTADGVIDQADLRRSLQVVLPEFMVPVHYVQVPEFPLTPNKKIDRKALPAPRRGGAVAAPVEPVAAVSGPVVAGQKTETGRQISEIWARILGLNSVSLRDNFFDLGGHSLLAIQAHREIRDTLKLAKISITDIFRFPVLSDLAARLDAQNVVATVAETEAPVAANDRATARGDAMSKRRAMRAKRRTAAQ
jgi:natural product biosynthesis luciferase-like monooxygenase protein